MTISFDDRLAIHELISMHGHIVDYGEFDRLHEVFTGDVEYDLTPMGGQVFHGVDAARDAALKLGDGNPVGHHVTNTVVDSTGDQVTARSKAIGIRKDGSAGSLVYDDILLLTGAGWRIAKRTITLRREPLRP
jgi:SnoaL-like domain